MALDLVYVALNAVSAIAKLVVVIAVGFVLERLHILTNDILKTISMLVVYVFTPCMIFVKIGDGVVLSELPQMWPLVVFPFIYIAIAAGIGYLALVSTCTFNTWQEAEKRAYVAAIMFGNIGNLPFSIVQSVVRTRDVAPFSSEKTAEDRGIAYVALFVAVGSSLLWTVGNYYLSHSTTSGTDVDNAEAKVGASLSVDTDTLESIDLSQPVTRSWRERLVSWFSHPSVKHTLLQPSILAIIFAILIVLFPSLQRQLFFVDDTYDPPLKAITEAIDLIGDCTIPTALLVLGASLSQQLSSHYAVVSRPMVLLNTLLKLVIMPIFGFSVVIALWQLGILPHNPLLLFVLILESAVPVAVNLTVLVRLSGNELIMNTLNSIMVHHYTFCTLTLIFVVTAAIEILV